MDLLNLSLPVGLTATDAHFDKHRSVTFLHQVTLGTHTFSFSLTTHEEMTSAEQELLLGTWEESLTNFSAKTLPFVAPTKRLHRSFVAGR